MRPGPTVGSKMGIREKGTSQNLLHTVGFVLYYVSLSTFPLYGAVVYSPGFRVQGLGFKVL